MFGRLLGMQVGPQVTDKLTPVIDGVIEKGHGRLDLDTVQGQNTFRALICSMVVHGWGLGMHPDNNPNADQDQKPIEVKVCKDILVPMEHLKSLRYLKKDSYGRVKKVLFEPDQTRAFAGKSIPSWERLPAKNGSTTDPTRIRKQRRTVSALQRRLERVVIDVASVVLWETGGQDAVRRASGHSRESRSEHP